MICSQSSSTLSNTFHCRIQLVLGVQYTSFSATGVINIVSIFKRCKEINVYDDCDRIASKSTKN